MIYRITHGDKVRISNSPFTLLLPNGKRLNSKVAKVLRLGKFIKQIQNVKIYERYFEKQSSSSLSNKIWTSNCEQPSCTNGQC